MTISKHKASSLSAVAAELLRNASTPSSSSSSSSHQPLSSTEHVMSMTPSAGSAKVGSAQQCRDQQTLFREGSASRIATSGTAAHDSLASVPPADDDAASILSTTTTMTTISNWRCIQKPILVGYAFGPKKMSTMGVVMAEASKTPLKAAVLVEEEVDDYEEEDDEGHESDGDKQVEAGGEEEDMLDESDGNESDQFFRSADDMKPNEAFVSSSPRIQQSHKRLTFAALQEAAASDHQSGAIVLTMASGPTGRGTTASPGLGLRHIVRHFRSAACSSIGDDEDDDDERFGLVSTSASQTTTVSAGSSHSIHQHPLRVSFVPLDLDAPLEEQHGGKFDVILHKMTEDILCLSTAQQAARRMEIKQEEIKHAARGEGEIDDIVVDDTLRQAQERIQRLNHYSTSHPQCALLDHPTRVQAVMSRWEISSLLQECLTNVFSNSGRAVSTPRYIQYSPQNEQQQRQPVRLSYPLIAKPLTAAGTKKSHCMGIILREDGLDDCSRKVMNSEPCLLQEYTNHDAILYKVYVLGEDVHVFTRPSIPNLPTDPTVLEGQERSFLQFDSHKPYPKLSDFGFNDISTPDSAVKATSVSTPTLTREEIAPVVQALRQAFGLALFGFDVLMASLSTGNTETNELLVVDVNYFPSYKEVNKFPSLLAKYLTRRAIQARNTANLDVSSFGGSKLKGESNVVGDACV